MDIITSIIAFFDLRVWMILALVFVPLERLMSLHAEQKTLRKTLTLDLAYVFIIGTITRFALLVVFAGILVLTALVVPPVVGEVVRSQHLILKVIEAMLLADIGVYIAHRAFHAVPFLWRFHAVHHSSEELDWLSAYRVHPIDQVATKGLALLPVFALGFSTETVAILFLIQQVHALLVHANTRLDFGPLKWLLVTPQFHHWHHANERHAYDKNFAAQFAFIDWLGGTMLMPGSRAYPAQYGVDEGTSSTNAVSQLVDPFKPRAPKAPDAAKTPAE